jgi:Spy/CpxP family protein refolding chaperone
MDVFAQNKLLLRLVALLVVINLASLSVNAWLAFSRSPAKPPADHNAERLGGLLQEELQLSDAQAAQMKQLRLDFFAKEKVLGALIRSQRDSMNVHMFNKQTDTLLLQGLAHRISGNELKMEMLRIEQARELKKVCTPAQVEKFENLVLEIRDYFRPEPKPGKK